MTHIAGKSIPTTIGSHLSPFHLPNTPDLVRFMLNQRHRIILMDVSYEKKDVLSTKFATGEAHTSQQVWPEKTLPAEWNWSEP